MSQPSFESCREIRDAVRSGERSAVSVIEDALSRIQTLNDRTNAFRDRFDDEAIEHAKSIDQQVAAGEDPGPLAGVPVGIKDNITTF